VSTRREGKIKRPATSPRILVYGPNVKRPSSSD
jgi:hypothetical protein